MTARWYPFAVATVAAAAANPNFGKLPDHLGTMDNTYSSWDCADCISGTPTRPVVVLLMSMMMMLHYLLLV